MDRYLIGRSEAGCAPLTIHHDAVCAKAFFRWCQRNDIIERNLLADYEVRRAPRPARYMPTDSDMQALLRAIPDFWNPSKNPPIRFIPVAKRVFHRDRNYAVTLGLLDSACRIGEMLSLKVDDYRAKERQIVIRESKGREPRTLPVGPEWIEAIDIWLRQRSKALRGQEDEGWLFISEYGGRLDESRFLKGLRKVTTYASLSDSITLHSLRQIAIMARQPFPCSLVRRPVILCVKDCCFFPKRAPSSQHAQRNGHQQDLGELFRNIGGHCPILGGPVIVSAAKLDLHLWANIGQLSTCRTRVGEVERARVQAVLRKGPVSIAPVC